MAATKFECQKFSPNIFNKSKCQHCFRAKDQHSAEALENNRASRKISKCGYLFVAPDWDFTIPLNRTKRWQRRWFVLYEDGELTYSVDEHPETIPQAIIDMTKVMEVADAEDVTGNKFAVAITASDKVHFIKGTCKEESKWWFDVLIVFPRSIMGRPKRNSTFPCKTSSSILQSETRMNDGAGTWNEAQVPRPRFLSCHTEPSCLGCDPLDVIPTKCPALKIASSTDDLLQSDKKGEVKVKLEDIVTRDIEIVLTVDTRRSRADGHYRKRANRRAQVSRSLGSGGGNNSSSNEDLLDSSSTSTLLLSADGPQQQHHHHHHRVTSPLYTRMSDVPLMKRYDSLESLHQDHNGPLSPRSWYQCEVADDEHADDERDVLLRRHHNHQQQQQRIPVAKIGTSHDDKSKAGVTTTTNAISSSAGEKLDNRHHHAGTYLKRHSVPASSTSTSSSTVSGHSTLSYSSRDKLAYSNNNANKINENDVPDGGSWREQSVRGDPDGCGLDNVVQSIIPEIRVDPLESCSEVYLNIKKGWMMKQEATMTWCKRWCVLYGSSLKTYLDPAAEDNGNLDSIISMNLVQHIEEVDVGRNYGMKIKMEDGKCHVFTAVTAGIRSSWIYGLKNAANLGSGNGVSSINGTSNNNTSNNDAILALNSDRLDKETTTSATTNKNLNDRRSRILSSTSDRLSAIRSHSSSSSTPVATTTSTTTTTTVRPVFSSDEELRTVPGSLTEDRTVSSGPDGGSCRLVSSPVAIAAVTSSPSTTAAANARNLPPSPPLNRTVISKVKERARLKTTNVKSNSATTATTTVSTGAVSAPSSGKSQSSKSRVATDNFEKLDWETAVVAADRGDSIIVGRLAELASNGKSGDADSLKEPGRSHVKNVRLKDKSRRYSLPGKCTSVVKPAESPSLCRSTGRTTRLSKDKADMKWHGDSHCSSIWERDRIIENLQDKLNRSQSKIQDLEHSIEGRLSSKENATTTTTTTTTQQPTGNSTVRGQQQQITNNDTVTDCHRAEIARLKESLDRANGELVDVVNKLQKATDKNELLRKALNLDAVGSAGGTKLADVATTTSGGRRTPLPRVSSLSDLTNIGEEVDASSASRETLAEQYHELRARFEKAVEEIRALRRELKCAYAKCDELDVMCMKQQSGLAAAEEDFRGQMRLMGVRIEDLTSKLNNSEKQLRLYLKPKGGSGGAASVGGSSSGKPTENKEQRRTRSLKGREALTVSKEVENKVGELEKKLQAVEGLLRVHNSSSVRAETTTEMISERAPPSGDRDSKPAHVFVRLNDLQTKVALASQQAALQSPAVARLDGIINGSETAGGCGEERSCSTDAGPVVVVISEPGLAVGDLCHSTDGSSALELALSSCRKKVERCKRLLTSLRLYHHTNSTSDAGRVDELSTWESLEDELSSALRCLDVESQQLSAVIGRSSAASFKEVVVRQILPKLNNVLLSSSQSTATHSNSNRIREVTLHKDAIVESVIRALTACVDASAADSPRRLTLYDCARLQRAILSLQRRLASTSSRSDVGEDYSIKTDGSVEDRLRSAVVELRERMVGVGRSYSAWRADRLTRLRLCSTSAQDGATTVDRLESDLRRAQATLLRRALEDEVAEVMAAAVLDSASEPIADDHNVPESRSSLIAHHLQWEVEDIVDSLRGLDAGQSATSITSVTAETQFDFEEFTGIVCQFVHVAAWLEHLQLVLEYDDDDDVAGSEGRLSPDQRPLPRIIGGVVKPGLASSTTGSVVRFTDRERRHQHQLKAASSQAIGGRDHREIRLEAWAPLTASSSPVAATRGAVASDEETSMQLVSSGGSLSTRSSGGDDSRCRHCKELQKKVQLMAEKYSSDLLLETERHQAKLEEVYRQHAKELSAMENNRVEDKENYCEDVRALHEKLTTLEEDYENQIVSLKEIFEQEISKRTDIKINKANVQRKYRAEIEQLKNLCEKGLVAMEHSHKRIIAELEVKHRREMEQLLAEKEQALAEETQATLAALDAMRKAHEAELQKEVARFKEEFLQTMGNSSEDLEVLHNEHREEMETIKRDILALSEKYSVKCLECASLEEHLEVVTQKLGEANTLIFDLTTSNKQLRIHIKQNIREMGLMTKGDDNYVDKDAIKSLKMCIRMKESQLVEKDEEIAELNRKLRSTKHHENQLETHCRLLDASLKAGSRSCEEEMGTLRARLEEIIMTNQTASYEGRQSLTSKDLQAQPQNSCQLSEPKSKKNIVGNASRGRELMRSPSCPGLSSEINSSKQSFKSNQTAEPLPGVVASRKRIFEYQNRKLS